jgi:DNA-binding MarR family transcriptional regulator
MNEPPDASGLSATVADVVARLRRAMRKAARARQPGMSLSVAQLELLSVVEERPGARPGDLAGLLRLAPNSVSTLANALVGAGMLARSPGTTDKRTVEYTLTHHGGRQVSRWRATNTGLLQNALEVLEGRDLRVLSEALPILERLIAVIDEQSDAAGKVSDEGIA